jgi:predicted MFS family arabinose efflux permease
MTTSVLSTRASTVDRRLHALGVEFETAIAVVGGLILLVADAWGLALTPLIADLEREYSLTPSQATWSLSLVGLIAAGCVPTVARLGDKVGMRPLVLASLVVGLVANVVCALASGFAVLLVGRAILGVSGPIPLVYAILRARGTNPQRVTRGVSLLTAASGVGVAVSYLLSGFTIAAHGSVRTVFWVMAGLTVVSLVLAWWLMPDTHNRSTESIDWLGALGVCVGLVGIVLAITEGGTWGWASGRVIGCLAGGIAVLCLWAWYESRQRHPLINVRRVVNRTAAPAFVVVAICATLAIYTNLAQATYVQLPTVTGYGLGLSVLQSSFTLCAISVALMVGGVLSASAVNRFGARPVMVAGALVITANFLVLAASHATLWHFIVWDVVWGFAWAFVYSGANAAYLQDATAEEAAMYSSANTVVTYAVGGLGPAIFVAILTSRTIPHTPIPDPVVFTRMWIFGAVAMAVVAVVALFVRRRATAPATTAAPVPATAGAEDV